MVIGYYIFSTLSKPLEIVLALYALLMGVFLVFGVLMLVNIKIKSTFWYLLISLVPLMAISYYGVVNTHISIILRLFFAGSGVSPATLFITLTPLI